MDGGGDQRQKTLSMSQAWAQVRSARRTSPAIPHVWMKRAELTRPAPKIATALTSERRGRRSTIAPQSPAARGKPMR